MHIHGCQKFAPSNIGLNNTFLKIGGGGGYYIPGGAEKDCYLAPTSDLCQI